jgi:tetratricopeptide (TPR) repeat protein
MDLLDFEADALYFDESITDEARHCLDQAAEDYGSPQAEAALMRAYFLEPEQPLVLVALYRYFYYQHRLTESLLVAQRVLKLYAKRLGFPEDWQDLERQDVAGGMDMPVLRFYLLALKGAGFLEMRLGQLDKAQACFRKVLEWDEQDRLGVKALLDLASTPTTEENN